MAWLDNISLDPYAAPPASMPNSPAAMAAAIEALRNFTPASAPAMATPAMPTAGMPPAQVAPAMRSMPPAAAATATMRPPMPPPVAQPGNLGAMPMQASQPVSSFAGLPAGMMQPAMGGLGASAPATPQAQPGMAAAGQGGNWAPIIAMALAGLSRDPSAVQRTMQGYMAGRQLQRQDDTTKALQLMGQHENPFDAMAAINQSGLQVDPSVMSTLIQSRWKLRASEAERLAKFQQDMMLEGVKQQFGLEKSKQELAGKKEVAGIVNKGRIDAAGMAAGARLGAAEIGARNRSKSDADLFNEYLGQLPPEEQVAAKREYIKTRAQKGSPSQYKPETMVRNLDIEIGKIDRQMADIFKNPLVAAKAKDPATPEGQLVQTLRARRAELMQNRVSYLTKAQPGSPQSQQASEDYGGSGGDAEDLSYLWR